MRKLKINSMWITLVFVSCMLCLTSCIKDEAGNKECDILNAWVEGDEYAIYFNDKNQMKVSDISSTETNITFVVRSLLSLSKQIPVCFDLTPGATIEPANGSLQDFTNGPVTYTVTSEDGEWTRQYKVAFIEPTLPTFKFSFEHVETSEQTYSGSYYHIFYEEATTGQRQDIWDSGNSGAALTLPYAQPDAFPTSSVEQGYQGKGVCLKTISAGSLGAMMKKPIAAGNLFLGKFIIENVLTDALKTTRFGVPIDREPVRVTGYYKYQPGDKFTDKDMHEVAGRTDEASIYAVFYRNKDSEGKDVYLWGNDVLDLNKLNTHPQVVKVAKMDKLPPTNEWTRFEMFFEGKDADDEELSEKKFNLALVFSSSKDGALFEGAIGSTLYVDEVEISFEK